MPLKQLRPIRSTRTRMRTLLHTMRLRLCTFTFFCKLPVRFCVWLSGGDLLVHLAINFSLLRHICGDIEYDEPKPHRGGSATATGVTVPSRGCRCIAAVASIPQSQVPSQSPRSSPGSQTRRDRVSVRQN